MSSLVSIDNSAVVSALAHDIVQMLAGVRHVMDLSISQDNKLHDIIALLATQTEQIRERDRSIMIMQSKIDSQQAVIEQIRSEQRLLTAAVTSLSQSYAQESQDVSTTLSPSEETPEPVTPTATPEKIQTSISIMEQPTSQTRPKLVPNDDNIIARANLKSNTTPDDPWVMPDCYAKTQRVGVLRRQGAFYATPDWDSMTRASGGVPDSGTPPTSPPGIQEDMFFTLKKVRADVHKKLEAKEKKNAVTIPTKDEAIDREDASSDASPCSSLKLEAREKMNAITSPTKYEARDHERVSSDMRPCNSPKRRRELDESEQTPNPGDISSIVYDAPDGSSPPPPSSSSSEHYPVPDDISNCDGPAKRRRLSEDLGESPTTPEKKRPTRRSPPRELNPN